MAGVSFGPIFLLKYLINKACIKKVLTFNQSLLTLDEATKILATTGK